jgi:hypothetical protein
MIQRAKKIELMNYFFVTHLNTCGSKMVLTLKIMDFENMTLRKIIHIYVIEDMNA